MNNVNLQKYGYSPEVLEENGVKNEKFRKIYDFYRLFKVKEHAERYAHADTKKEKTSRRRLRETLMFDKRVLAQAEQLKKKNALQAHIYKPTTEKISFFDREKIFVVKKFLKNLAIATCIEFQKKVMIK